MDVRIKTLSVLLTVAGDTSQWSCRLCPTPPVMGAAPPARPGQPCTLPAWVLGASGAPDRRKTATDLGWKVGDFQGYDDGELFGQEVTSGENPGGREAHGAGAGSRELEAPCALGLHGLDSSRGTIRRDHLCQDVQGTQICVKGITGGLGGVPLPGDWDSQHLWAAGVGTSHSLDISVFYFVNIVRTTWSLCVKRVKPQPK